MDIHIFLQKLEKGTVKIDKNGHCISGKYSIEKLIKKLQWHISYYKEKIEEEEGTSGIHSKFLAVVEKKDCFKPGKDYYPILSEVDVYCNNCGDRGLQFYIKDINTLAVRHYEKGPITCVLAGKLKPIKTRIRVPTGNLIFINHFCKTPEAPYGKKYTSEYSLNYLLGRMNIAKYLASKNIGFGQVGNTTIEVYLSKDKKSIKICEGTEYLKDDVEYFLNHKEEYTEGHTPSEEEIKKYHDIKLMETDYTFIDSISLAVWRWMCADKAVIRGASLPIRDDLDVVVCAVEPGTWEITHYYDILKKDGFLVSELKLLK